MDFIGFGFIRCNYVQILLVIFSFLALCNLNNWEVFVFLIHLCSEFWEIGSLFGKHNKLAPIPEEKKRKWRKEVNWLLSVTDNIVEFVPSQQIGKDGSNMEVIYLYLRLFCVLYTIIMGGLEG